MTRYEELLALLAGDLLSSECWLWPHSTKKGYGQMWHRGRMVLVHRVAYEAVVGSIPAGLHLDHLCRSRACFNPSHLEPVTAAENNARCPTWGGNRTECLNGHRYEEANVRINPADGKRVCRTCARENTRRYRQRMMTMMGDDDE